MTEEEMQKKAKAIKNAVASVRSRRDAIERELSKLERVALLYSLGIDGADGVKVSSSGHPTRGVECTTCCDAGESFRTTFEVPNGATLLTHLCAVCLSLAVGSEIKVRSAAEGEV